MNFLLGKILFSGIFSFLITFYLVPVCCALAQRWRFMDIPDDKLKQHAHATPFMGGVAVYCGFLAGIALTVPFDGAVIVLLIGSTLLLFLGLLDDLIALAPHQKFFGQLLVAICFLKSGFYLKEHFFYHIINIPLSFLWILTVINAFNLVDVMDGLATTLALGASASFLAIAWYSQAYAVLILLSAFMGALCAFLWYNKPAARIYLGDAGSLFIGGFLAVMPFLLQWGTYTPHGYLAPIIILGIPLLECVSLIVIRWRKGIPFYRGSPDHFCHYLMRQEWSKAGILVYTVVLSLGIGFVAFLSFRGVLSFIQIGILGALFVLMWFFRLGFWGFRGIRKSVAFLLLFLFKH